jgi:hypothetical protein
MIFYVLNAQEIGYHIDVTSFFDPAIVDGRLQRERLVEMRSRHRQH